MRNLSLCLLAATLSLAPTSAHAVRTAGTVAVEDGCAKCGPSPCCIVLWVVWCGCPFADRVVPAGTANLLQSKCSPTHPEQTVMSNDKMSALLKTLERAKPRSVSCVGAPADKTPARSAK